MTYDCSSFTILHRVDLLEIRTDLRLYHFLEELVSPFKLYMDKEIQIMMMIASGLCPFSLNNVDVNELSIVVMCLHVT